MKQYIVDAFTDQLFCGNPAAVCVLEEWISDELMKKIAAENNLSETAFVVKEKEGYHLRWFTPTAEIELCGHATLATSFVIFNYIDKNLKQLVFNTQSGKLIVRRNKDLYEMDFPIEDYHETEVTDLMEEAIGIRPIKAILGLDLVCVLENEELVQNATINQSLVEKLPARMLHITSKGNHYDCVTRSFGPKIGIVEDPVCGSAHCMVASYYSNLLNKKDIIAYQASQRTGVLYCHMKENKRISISGKAVLFSISEINL